MKAAMKAVVVTIQLCSDRWTAVTTNLEHFIAAHPFSHLSTRIFVIFERVPLSKNRLPVRILYKKTFFLNLSLREADYVRTHKV